MIRKTIGSKSIAQKFLVQYVRPPFVIEASDCASFLDDTFVVAHNQNIALPIDFLPSVSQQ